MGGELPLISPKESRLQVRDLSGRYEQSIPEVITKEDFTYIALPTYGPVIHPGTMAMAYDAFKPGDMPTVISSQSTPLLVQTFNLMLCEALNMKKRPKYFAMLHSDIVPEIYWLQKMISMLEDNDLDLLSVVSPIKDERGLSSTGVGLETGQLIKYITIKMASELPPVFTIDDIDKDFYKIIRDRKPILFINTGCWVCRFTDKWVEKIFFETKNFIAQDEEGRFIAHVLPEDWHLSVQLATLKRRYAATAAIKLKHYGNEEWSNQYDPDKV